jgi:essential nuclear protein 1
VSVVHGVVDYFRRSSLLTPEEPKPVLWFQCLLTFVERYKISVTKDDKETLRIVCKRCVHKQMTPVIRTELFGAAAFRDGNVGAGAAAAMQE